MLDDFIWYLGQICYGVMSNLADDDEELDGAVADNEWWALGE